MIIKYYNGLSVIKELLHKKITNDDVISWRINTEGFFKNLRNPPPSLYISFKDGSYLHENKTNIINYEYVIKFIKEKKLI